MRVPPSAILVLLGCAFLAAVVLAPGKVEVNGKRVPIGAGWTVGDCVRFAGLRLGSGDLLDGHGSLLTKGGGATARMWRNGTPSEPAERVRPGDRLCVAPARDVTEPVVSRIRHLDSPPRLADGRVVRGGSSRLYVSGVRRERWGSVSGELLSSEVTYASAVVRKAVSVDRSRCVALTFDDGPNDTWTPQYQAVLSRHGARATFFVLGQAVKHFAPVVRGHLELGNEVGVHSWHHDDFRKLSQQQVRDDLKRCLRVMREVGVREVRWFRPPYGEHPRGTDQVARELGLRIAMWDVDTNDWRLPGADKIVARALKGLRGGVVILMHDGPRRREQTLAAIRVLIPAIQKRGYQLVTMSEAKGLVPNFTGDVVYAIGGKELRLRAMPGAQVEVNGAVVPLEVGPFRAEQEIVVPARSVAGALGAKVTYDKATETLTVEGVGGTAVMELDSPQAMVNGQGVTLTVPALLYGRQVLAPVSVLKRVCGASCMYDEVARALRMKPLASAWVLPAGLA